MEPDTGSSSRLSTATGFDQNPPVATSSRLGESAAVGSRPMGTSVAGSNERTATSEASNLLQEIEAKSSRKRAAHVGSNQSKTVEVTSRPISGIDIESIPQSSTRTRSGQSSVIVISRPRTSINTESGRSSIIAAESNPKTTTTGSDQSSAILSASTTRKSRTTGPGQSSVIRTGSTQRGENFTEPDSGPSTVVNRRRKRVVRPTQKETIAVGTDISLPPAGGSPPRRSTRQSIAAGTTVESPPRRSTDISSYSDWETFLQYIDTSSMADWSEGAADRSAATGPSPEGSTEHESSPPRRSTRQSIAAGTTVESPPRRSTDISSDSDWETFAQYLDTSSMADWSEGAADRSAATGPRPRGSTEHESSPQSASYTGSRPRGSIEHESSYTGYRPRGSTYAGNQDPFRSNLPTDATFVYPPDTTFVIRRATDSTSSQTGAPGLRPTPRGPSLTGFSPNNTPARATETTTMRSSATRSTERDTGRLSRQLAQTSGIGSPVQSEATSTPSRRLDSTYVLRSATDSRSSQTGAPGLRPSARGPPVTNSTPERATDTTTRRSSVIITTETDTRRLTRQLASTSDVGSAVQSDVPQEESVEQKNVWALRDLSVYQLTVKSLVVAIVSGVQFSSGSNGEGGIYCSNNEVCIWHEKPKGTIGVDFQLDIRNIVAAIVSSGLMFVGLSRIPGERSFSFLMPWLLLVTLSLQKFHIAAVLNLLAFLTTCSHISAVVLMFLCLVLVYLEINVFYEVFMCAWNLHEDPSLKEQARAIQGR